MLGNLKFLGASALIHTQTYIHTYSNTCTCTYEGQLWQDKIGAADSCSCFSHAHMHVSTYVCMYICIHISMTRVSRATFVLLQLPLICTYACIYVCLHVYMYPYLNDKSQPRHFCLVTAASDMHICMYLRMSVTMYVSTSQWLTRYLVVASCVMWIRTRR